ncbi:MlaD family protein [Thetidibacter halocola]|uniref:MCE family protein n=1 Tax=Thetidibacter halocola TaxID=2827239 RepID=A0A8J8BAA7_9RHOB|nr:MlaD family protein [Thetidibacter halocola]MBS0126709.1 MCE family protein [Thetidibacter halocola]
METRANFVLVGAFAIAGFLGLMGFFLWFANVELDRQFAYYDVDFETVSGLSNASDVRFAGLPVGQVVDVRLSPENDGRVRVRVEIEAGVPVRTDSVATIEAQGVTGVSFVGISAGTPDAPLATDAGDDVPRIEAGQSVLQSLSQDAPQILSETLEVVRQVREMVGPENQTRVEAILQNVERSSASFEEALGDFADVTGTVSDFASQIDRFNTTLESLTQDVGALVREAQTTLSTINSAADEARILIAEGTGALAQANTTLATADSYLSEGLGPTTEALNRTVEDVQTRFAALTDSAGALVETFTETGTTATARLTEAQETLAATNALIARIDTTLGSVDTAAQRLDGLLTDSAQPLIDELRTATAEATDVIRLVGDTARTDLPAIFADIRSATENATQVIERVGQDLTGASGQLDTLATSATQTLEDARVTFANANETLEAINAALETGDRALAAAERAFEGADTVINRDAADIAARLRGTIEQLDAAIAAVAEDIPAVTEELRSASRSAEQAFAGIEGVVGQSAPAFRAFAAEALPQYTRLATETRDLIGNLDRLVEQIRSNPSRFFLDSGAPEYRR